LISKAIDGFSVNVFAPSSSINRGHPSFAFGKTMLREKIKSFVESCRREMTDDLSALVAIPTANPPGKSYGHCVDHLSGLLKKWHISHEMIPVSAGRYPRFCIQGGVGEGQEGLHFHGHYDVVPSCFGSQFDPLIRKGCLYGRGSSDMKSGLVAILYALKFLEENRTDLGARVSFSFVPDEESGSHLGARFLAQNNLFPRPAFGMLMPEPTSGAVWYANKGALTLRVDIQGKPAHVALEHQGENAFESMTGIVRSLLELKKTISRRETNFPVDPPEAKKSVMLIGGESGSGINFNVVPDRAFFTVDRRLNPEEKITDAKRELMQVFDAAKKRGIKVTTKVLQEGDSSTADPNSPLAKTLKDAIRDVRGDSPSMELCPGLCEIRFFNNQGIPAYAYGPGLLEVSHGPEEYVRIPDMLICTEIFILTALRLLGPRRS
jgi:succinyl-diaminopimelate desuccinylase